MDKKIENTWLKEELKNLESRTQPKDLFKLATARRVAIEQKMQRPYTFYWITAGAFSCALALFFTLPNIEINAPSSDHSTPALHTYISDPSGETEFDDTGLHYWLDIYD